ncbi:MAG: IS4 family transposase, partial [Burkholderiales bacterium]
VYLLAYNLIRLMMAQAALVAQCLPRQLSFKHAVQIWNAWDHQGQSCEPKVLDELFALIAQLQVGNRPGRIEPRAIKRRSIRYPLLTEHRQAARSKVRRF